MILFFSMDILGGDPVDLGEIDGVDMWKALSENLPSPRNEILHNIDDSVPYAAIRIGDYKLVQGNIIFIIIVIIIIVIIIITIIII